MVLSVLTMYLSKCPSEPDQGSAEGRGRPSFIKHLMGVRYRNKFFVILATCFKSDIILMSIDI